MEKNQAIKAKLQEAILKLPRVRLANLPTPLEECPRLSKALGGPRILIKRDDLTGLAFGGNKSRKYEFIMGRVKKIGADAIIHSIFPLSNDARQLSAAAAKLGISVYLVSLWDMKSKRMQGNLFLDYLLGANIIFSNWLHGNLKRELAETLRKRGYNPYIIGHYDDVLGTVAYVNCALELHDQLEELGLTPDYIILASGGSTQAGLILGAKILQQNYKIIGFRPVKASYQKMGLRMIKGNNDAAVAFHISELANEAAKLLGFSTTVSARDVLNYDNYVGKGYGAITKECCEAIELVARTEGILLDPIYTGKAMAGLIDYIRKGIIKADKTVVFLHTGGTPALFSYNKEIARQLRYRSKIFTNLKLKLKVWVKELKKRTERK